MKPNRTLYRLVFPNGSTYVGITKSMSGRMWLHRADAKTGTSRLYVAWREVGAPRIEALAIVEEYMWSETERRAVEVLKPDLNTYPGGYGVGKTISAVAREKNSLAHKGKTLSADHRAKLSAAHKGKKFSDETRVKMSKPKSDETRAKMSAARKGKPKSDEHRAKLGAAQLARYQSKRATPN